MAQLQKKPVHAMADRLDEAKEKISIVKAQIMAEEAHQARIYQEHLQLQLQLQQQGQNDQMHLNLHNFLSLQQGSERAPPGTQQMV